MKKFSGFKTCPRFSIRKFSIGVASVLLGSVAVLGTNLVSADELTAETAPLVLVAEEVKAPDDSAHTEQGDMTNPDNVNNDQLDKTVSESAVELPNHDLTEHLEVASTGLEVADTFKEIPEEKGMTEVAIGKIDLSDVTEVSTATMTRASYSPFRKAQPSTAIGDNYPQVWKNGVVWQSTDKWNLFVKECVSFAAFRLSTVNGFEMPLAYGNANQWGHRAKSEGYRVDGNPAIGAIAWYDSYQFDAYGNGHVAWVSNVWGDQVELEEYNYGYPGHAYNRRTIHKSRVSGYIHFKDVVGGTRTKVTPEKASQSSLAPSGTYTFTKELGIKAEPKLSSPDLAHYAVGQTVNYDKVLETDGHQWISYLSYAGNRRYIPVNALTPKVSANQLDGKISIKNKDDNVGRFDIIVSNVPTNADIRTVKLAVWSSVDGKDDLVWYTARKQGDGKYKTTVSIEQHDDYRGEYTIQLQYVKNDRQKVTLGKKKLTVGLPQAEQPIVDTTETSPVAQPVTPKVTIPPQGTYHFTKRASIKAEPKMSSPELAYYDVGYSVNYDSIVMSEGRHWLSYLSFAGNRRYIALP